ncbi:hypothetical protein GJ744_006991 [Endocarpon pusillum]|uniref:Uncharacterized protein n=1 Tax=Endocarpon pusillum TaxID=364733 RepID=A0A8H7DWP1_9EURO|nr:hypothetical protein GJ744_006991 [Endocarpon pusillum]
MARDSTEMAKDGINREASATRTERSFSSGSVRITGPEAPVYVPLPQNEEADDDQEENLDEPDPPLPPPPKNPQSRRESMNQLGFNALVDELNKKIQDIKSPTEALNLMAQDPKNALRLIKGLGRSHVKANDLLEQMGQEIDELKQDL